MGFDTILLGKAVFAGTQAAGSMVNARAQRSAARDVKSISDYHQQIFTQKADVMKDEMVENTSRMRKNANAQMGKARADAGGANLAADGSVAVREMDLATRLEGEILDEARKSLQQIDDLKKQADIDAMNANARIRSYRTGAVSSLLSGAGDVSRTLVKW